MRVRLVTSVSLPKWEARVIARRYNDLWHKLVARALARNKDRCPKCGCRDFARSRRKNFIEFTISRLALPYRCPHCYLRFFRAVESSEADDAKRYRAQYAGLQHARRT